MLLITNKLWSYQNFNQVALPISILGLQTFHIKKFNVFEGFKDDIFFLNVIKLIY